MVSLDSTVSLIGNVVEFTTWRNWKKEEEERKKAEVKLVGKRGFHSLPSVSLGEGNFDWEI